MPAFGIKIRAINLQIKTMMIIFHHSTTSIHNLFKSLQYASLQINNKHKTKQISKSLHFQEYFEQLILLSNNHVIISVCQATQTYRTCQETQMVSQVVVEVTPLILIGLALIQSNRSYNNTEAR